MSDWTTKTLQHGSCTIIIERPILPEAELNKRAQNAKATIERTLRNYVKRKELKK